jgi:hypothetical protein
VKAHHLVFFAALLTACVGSFALGTHVGEQGGYDHVARHWQPIVAECRADLEKLKNPTAPSAADMCRDARALMPGSGNTYLDSLDRCWNFEIPGFVWSRVDLPYTPPEPAPRSIRKVSP